MKKNLYLYLFIFALLINVFTYMYFTQTLKHEGERIVKVQEKVKKTRDSLTADTDKRRVSDYFTIENDANARDYFKGQDIDAIAIKVRDGIYAQNANTKGNPLVQYPAMDNRPFTVSKIKILNHRWIIVDFSNGLRWGEALLKYFVEDDGKITYETVDTTLFNFVPY
ncbi:hypothetical protein FMM05_10540 [Flavobacterium zepuense]|uniref:Hydrolase n=1 Tax=Flavobacterium zepuense TaxID=2593302 RepID=A0A552V1C4_9FLAO|nr:hypothetical protein [Flavobacterium zepuense]TRW24264.1 hypothetical protein FMM05_10540 [Flavobacterium zepuense]